MHSGRAKTVVAALAASLLFAGCNRSADIEKVPVGSNVQLTRDDGGVVEGTLAARDTEIPFLPGVATAADIMRGIDLGLERFKFFPAVTSGGIPALQALSGPFGNIRFCPTGGVRPETAKDWLALPSVLCVGGTWFVKPGDDLAAIGDRARAASGLC